MEPITETSEKSYPVKLIIPQQERYSRWLALATILLFIPKFIILIPHIIVLYCLSIASCFAFIIGQFAVLIMGRYPKALFNFIVGTTRWKLRISAYMLGLTDVYPPFQLRD